MSEIPSTSSTQRKNVTQPEVTSLSNFNFSIPEDPDAAFKPMVTPYHSTRVDPNCGKIEGTLEG